jgi:hypothetical protein
MGEGMGQPIVITSGDPAGGDEAAAFAAGVAAATAVQATEDAQEAQATAETAEAIAQDATRVAEQAQSDAISAEVKTYGLDARIDRLEAIVEDLTDAVAGDGGGEAPPDPTVPPKITVTVEGGEEGKEEDKPKTSKPRERTFGAPGWFRR